MRATTLGVLVGVLLALLACGGGSDSGGTGGTSGVTIPTGQACGITAKGDAASGVGTVVWSGQLATCTSGSSANTQVIEEVNTAIGSSSTFILAEFLDAGTSKAYGAGFAIFYGLSGTVTAPMPLNTDITPTDGLGTTFEVSTLSAQVQGGWATTNTAGSATMRITSRTATTTGCTGNGITCYLLHGTLHAVMPGKAATGVPAGKGTITLDVAF